MSLCPSLATFLFHVFLCGCVAERIRQTSGKIDSTGAEVSGYVLMKLLHTASTHKQSLLEEASWPEGLEGYSAEKDEPLGSGDYGETWLAKKTTGEEAAVKVFKQNGKILTWEDVNGVTDLQLSLQLSAKLDQISWECEIAQELHAGSQLQEPGVNHVMRCLENGANALSNGTGPLFLALEYCPGKSLKRTLEDTSLSANTRIHLVQQIFEALAVLARKGYAHHDLHFENILVSPSLDVKVIDFGLSSKMGDPLDRLGPFDPPFWYDDVRKVVQAMFYSKLVTEDDTHTHKVVQLLRTCNDSPISEMKCLPPDVYLKIISDQIHPCLESVVNDRVEYAQSTCPDGQILGGHWTPSQASHFPCVCVGIGQVLPDPNSCVARTVAVVAHISPGEVLSIQGLKLFFLEKFRSRVYSVALQKILQTFGGEGNGLDDYQFSALQAMLPSDVETTEHINSYRAFIYFWLFSEKYDDKLYCLTQNFLPTFVGVVFNWGRQIRPLSEPLSLSVQNAMQLVDHIGSFPKSHVPEDVSLFLSRLG